MKAKLGYFIGILCSIFLPFFPIYGQGYIVLNGVDTNSFPGEINVWNPTGTQATTFSLDPFGKQQPTVYTNVFNFNEPATIGVRVFLVQANDAISLQPILSQAWTELGLGNNYDFANGVPFYVGLYTGGGIAQPWPFSPPYTYNDPVFGWAELENINGVIRVLNYAVEYQGGGIFAGTQNIIPVPEPSTFALAALGGLLLGFCRWKK